MPKTFQQAVDPEGNPIEQSAPMMQPAEQASPGPAGIEPYDQNVNQAETQLNALLSQYPDVDYQGKYQELVKGVENRPVSESPNPLLSFAYAMGSPEKAPAILHEKMIRKQEEADKKDADLMKLKENLLQGTIQQEIAKGNFKLALSQSEKLADLQRANADRERFLNMQDWKQKQQIKTEDAGKLIKKRVSQLAANFHLTEKQALEAQREAARFATSLAGKMDIMGNPAYTSDEIADLTDAHIRQAYSLSSTLQNPPAKVETPKVPTAGEKLRSIIENNRKNKQ